MGSEGSVGSIRSAGSGQSSEGTNGHGTGLLIENAQVGGRRRREGAWGVGQSCPCCCQLPTC